MSEDGETIIEEYLTLVREKLPDSIADDVISELRSYMHESARDQGDGEITIQSAKKVVAQFGAPGEVADEYKYSMFPETIPEEIAPSEIIQEQQKIIQEEPMQQVQQEPVQLTPISKENPTVGYFSFFLTTSVQAWIWILVASLVTTVTGPIWFPSWSMIVPISQAILVTLVLYFLSLSLKWRKTLLWRRAFREWSSLQNFVTLPENSIPELGSNIMVLDILASLMGIGFFLLSETATPYLSFFLVSSVIPVCILLMARIFYRVKSLRSDQDPIRYSRKQFAINISLLIALNTSIFWLFNSWEYPGSYLIFWSPLLVPFILVYGSVVLFNVVTGTQNLWWKTEEQTKASPTTQKEFTGEEKEQLLSRLPRNMWKLYGKMTGWIVVYNLPLIYVSFDHASFHFVSGAFYNWIGYLVAEIGLVGLLVASYFLYRRFFIKRLDSRNIFGQRTRGEAIIDSLIGSGFLAMILMFIFTWGFYNIAHTSIINYQRHLGVRWSIILATMEIAAYPLGAVALIFRITGNIHEFRPALKKRATSLVELSGVLLILALTALLGVQYLKWIADSGWYGFYEIPYMIFLPILIFLAFQVASSSLKGKMLKKSNPDKRGNSVNSRDI
ncbi:MAG: hypothetical protein BV458_11675, partial [Thermoplasmata archaeon M9B2D]